MASIDHAMWFHRPLRVDDWLLYALESPSASGARGFARASVFSRDGRLVASTAQEGLIRDQEACMNMLSLSLALAAGSTAGTEADALQHFWSGVRDTSEQVVFCNGTGLTSARGLERRVRAVVEPVDLPWLGPHVLYFEEFLHDDPDILRRQLLVRLEAAEPPRAVSVRGCTRSRTPSLEEAESESEAARCPEERGYCHDPQVRPDVLAGGRSVSRCHAGTRLDVREAPSLYVDYLLIGQRLYWYRRRLMRKSDNEL